MPIFFCVFGAPLFPRLVRHLGAGSKELSERNYISWPPFGAASEKHYGLQHQLAMILRQWIALSIWLLLLAFTPQVSASYGDRLPEFQECVEVQNPSCHQIPLTGFQVCKRENCASGRAATAIRKSKPPGKWYL
jgi:hypothetical protein